MSNWLRVCRIEEIAPDKARVVSIEGVRVAVFRTRDGECYAIEDRCPHRGAPLSQGVIYQKNKVACLDHGWGICLLDGQVEAPQRGQVRTFKVKVEAQTVWVKS